MQIKLTKIENSVNSLQFYRINSILFFKFDINLIEIFKVPIIGLELFKNIKSVN